MELRSQTDDESRHLGFQILIRKLGLPDALRFIQKCNMERGDYTQDRHEWLDTLTMMDVLDDIKCVRAEQTK